MVCPKHRWALVMFVIYCAAAQGQQVPIEEVLVTGRAQQYYLETDTTLGSKLDIDILNLPQSVQVLSEQLIIDQAARTITDLYRSIAGVSEFSYSGVTIRGFRESDNVFYDGVRGDPYSGFSVPQLFNVERVEILKGPTASLYGGGDPGGMINYVTKQATFSDEVQLALTTGNDSLYGASADVRGGLFSTVAGRVGAYYQQQDSFRDNADQQILEVAGGLVFELGQQAALTASVDYVDQDLRGHRLRGIPARDDGEFIASRAFNANEEQDYQTLDAWVGQLNLRQRFDNSLSLNATLRYLDNDRTQGYHEPRGWDDANGDGVADENDSVILREYRLQKRSNEETSLTIDWVKDFSIWGTQQEFLVGGDYHDVDTDFSSAVAFPIRGGVPSLNILNPQYGQVDPITYERVTLPFNGTSAEVFGVYLQDYITLNDNWRLMLGLRYDKYKDKDKADYFALSDDNIALRLGLVFKPVEQGSLYINYAESFRPVPLVQQQDPDRAGSLEPETGFQWELGWKQMWLEGRFRTTAAVYLIDKKDVPQANPDDSGLDDGVPALVNLGKVESKGLELTLVGDITDDWTLTANYAWNNTEVKKGAAISNSLRDGSTFANAPENQAGLWTRYELDAVRSAIAVGVSYVSDQFNLDEQKVKAFTVFDASWTTEWQQLTLQLNINNVLDKQYFVSGFSRRNGNFPGSPREVILQLKYSL